jgi:uncharacterized membrane protein YcaP (DUF421 family)
MTIFGFDLAAAFTPDVSLFEIFVRGSVLYLSLFILLRVVLRRKTGAVAFTDLLVLVLIADAAQNAMAADYTSITDGLALVGTLVFWAYAIDWLGYRVPRFRLYVHPDPKPLVEDGHVVQRSLDQELMTVAELMTQLRLGGAERIEDVRAAFIEGNGQVSVLKRDNEASAGKARQSAIAGG